MSEIGAVGGEAFNAGSFVTQAVNEGLSMRQAISTFRESGGRMSNQAFRSLYGQVRDAIGGREAIQALDYGQVPSADVYGTWGSGEAGRYSTFVTSYVRRAGERELEPRYYTYTTDMPHPPQEAIDAAADWLTTVDVTSDSFGAGSYQTGVVTSMVRST